ncbi:MAG: barstar family protein [Segetibacter sp.]
MRHAVTNLKVMAVFRNHPTEWNNHDWTILRSGSISLYWRQDFLVKDIEWFQKEKYNIVRLNCSTWTDEEQMHQELYDKLKLPDYYGSNYDALDECLEDIEIKDTGLIVVFEHFDKLQKDTRQILLDIFDRASRFHLLMGQRIINLVQVDNVDTEFEPIKAYHINWNRREWHISDRQKTN